MGLSYAPADSMSYGHTYMTRRGAHSLGRCLFTPAVLRSPECFVCLARGRRHVNRRERLDESGVEGVRWATRELGRVRSPIQLTCADACFCRGNASQPIGNRLQKLRLQWSSDCRTSGGMTRPSSLSMETVGDHR